MLANHLQVDMVPVDALALPKRKLRKHPQGQIRKIAASIERFGMNVPVLVDETNEILAGAATLEACVKLGFDQVPVVRISHLTQSEKRLFRIAHNRLAEDGEWDSAELRIELKEIAIDAPKLDLSLTGFAITEVDRMLGYVNGDLSNLDAPIEPDREVDPVTKLGDVWTIGDHRLLCGDATKPADLEILMGEQHAQVWLTDPPYNVPISGHVSGLGKKQHREFAMAAGEMTPDEFETFLASSIAAASAHIADGGLFYVFMDAKHLIDLELAARREGLSTLNICVWVKDNGGMGSFYRSQHELVLVAKRASERAPHTNTIELGKNGRYRTNVWSYAGVNSFGEGRDEALSIHPTVKPVSMLADAILDCTKPGDIVLDSFGGSGSTMVAAASVGRQARLIELDPLYCDAILCRMQQAFDIEPVHLASGRSFGDLVAARRESEERVGDER